MKASKRIFVGLLVMSGIVFPCAYRDCGVNTVSAYAIENNKIVNTSDELVVAVESAKDGAVIMLGKDIKLDKDIKVRRSITIDLDGHTIDVGEKSCQLICGCKTLDHVEKKEIVHPPEITRVPRLYMGEPHIVWEQKVIPSWTEYKHINIYKYDNSIKITIKNGKILKGSSKKINKKEDNKYNKFAQTCGEKGKTYNEPLRVVSGTVYLDNMTILGCDGQDGQDGGYQRMWHVPFFGGGRGGNGGDGGDGSYAVFLENSEAKIVLGQNCELKGGAGGNGGKGSKANPRYWIYSGKKGKDGKNGERRERCNNEDRVIIIRNNGENL